MDWTDQVTLQDAARLQELLRSDQSLLPQAEADVNVLLRDRLGITPPVPLKLRRLQGRFILTELNEADAGPLAYETKVVMDDDELHDEELDLVAGGACVGPTTSPFNIKN